MKLTYTLIKFVALYAAIVVVISYPLFIRMRELFGSHWESADAGFSIGGILLVALPIALIYFGPRALEKIREKSPWIGSYVKRDTKPACLECESVGKHYSVDTHVMLLESWEHSGDYHRFPVLEFEAKCTNGHTWVSKKR